MNKLKKNLSKLLKETTNSTFWKSNTNIFNINYIFIVCVVTLGFTVAGFWRNQGFFQLFFSSVKKAWWWSWSPHQYVYGPIETLLTLNQISLHEVQPFRKMKCMCHLLYYYSCFAGVNCAKYDRYKCNCLDYHNFQIGLVDLFKTSSNSTTNQNIVKSHNKPILWNSVFYLVFYV